MSLADQPTVQTNLPTFAGIFPLPLTIFEIFMLVDARVGYPMMCDLELHFQGSIDRAAFDSGLAFAMARNPLFRSLVIDHGPKQLAWQLTDRLPLVDWAPAGTPRGARYDKTIDLRVDIGLRVWVRHDIDRSTVLFHFHHACADGMGGFAFIEDFLVGYAAAFPQSAPVEARPLEPQRLNHRQDFGIDQRSFWRTVGDSLLGVREFVKFFAEAPRPLPTMTPHVEGHTVARSAGFLSQPLSEEVTSGLRCAAGNAGATLNDLLLRDLLIAMRDWSRAAGDDPGQRRLRILVPQNLRQREDRGMPAANVMGFAFITRRANMCDHGDQLLTSIRDETELLRRYRLSLFFLGGIAAAQSTGMFPWMMRRTFCFSTSVLTNLGDPTRRFVARLPRSGAGLVVGNLVFEQITGGPPVRPLTKAAFSIFNSARNLSISLKCDPHCYSSLDTQRLLGQYVAQLRSTGERALAARAPGG